MKIIFQCVVLLSIAVFSSSYANHNVLNVYAWSEEVPHAVIEQFEKETGIKVNYSSFDNNEVMYTKIRTNNKGYDIVEPSSYYIERMQKKDMLQPLDKAKLPNAKYLDPFFLGKSYDPSNTYSIPFLWGVTGIFINHAYYKDKKIRRWSDLSHADFANRLMLLDESRAVFAMALRSLGYSINDKNPQHIYEAYQTLVAWKNNIRLFNSDAVISLLIDEDATAGMVWNGDAENAKKENPHLDFIFPEDGFEIWVDHFVLLKNAPHPENAYQFLNFLLRPDIARAVSLMTNYSTTNLAGRELLPDNIKHNPALYPSYAVLRRGEFQLDHGDEASKLMEKYWEELKMSG